MAHCGSYSTRFIRVFSTTLITSIVPSRVESHASCRQVLRLLRHRSVSAASRVRLPALWISYWVLAGRIHNVRRSQKPTQQRMNTFLYVRSLSALFPIPPLHSTIQSGWSAHGTGRACATATQLRMAGSLSWEPQTAVLSTLEVQRAPSRASPKPSG